MSQNRVARTLLVVLGLSMPCNSATAQCQQAAFNPGSPVAFDHFGQAVSLSGTAAVVGCPDHDGAAGFSQGAVVVYRRNGRSWTLEQEILPSDPGAADYFGYSVSVDNNVLVVGAFGDDPSGLDSGSAYVFRWSGTTWVEEATLTASDGVTQDFFGYSVSVDGEQIAVGALFGDDQPQSAGAVYIYRRIGTTWTEEAKVSASDAATTDYLGNSVALSGNVVVAGAHYTAGTYQGAAYVFRKSGGVWTEEQKLTASDGHANAFFGYSVDLYSDVIIVGAYGDSDLGANAGKVYLFRKSGFSWIEEAPLTASNAQAGDEFGAAVATTGEIIVVGSKGGAGQAYEFRQKNGVWTEEFNFTGSDVGATSAFGSTASADGNFALVGAPLHDDPANDVGSAYLLVVSDEVAGFSNYGAGWSGTLGVPTLSSLDLPVLGSLIKIRVGNSAGFFTFGFLLLGITKASIPTNLGGTLLVIPTAVVPLVIPFPWVDLPVTVPCNSQLLGLPIYLQVLESDPGASNAISFTPGLQMDCGY